jgi:hypothetical protein
MKHARWIAAALCLACLPAAGRDWRTWPFSSASPWNMPIGSNAQYAPVPGLAALGAGLNFDDRWTSSVVVSKASDPLVHVLVNATWPTNNWSFLAHGKPNCGNTAADEALIRGWVQASPPAFPANPWSTLSPVEAHQVLPASFHDAHDHARTTIHLKPGFCPSPDTDGLMAVFQPDGWVLDTYATIILGNGDIVGDGLASFVDARGDGTGWWNGRRASMLPSFAGLIRNGELASGLIPHALAAVMSSSELAKAAVWPAAAFDRHADAYAGTLPMGALLAIPADVDLAKLGLSAEGLVLARAAQDYGVYVVDSTNGAGVTLMAQLGDPEIRWPGWQSDVATVVHHLQQVTNNAAATPGGGGTPRKPLAPEISD